MPIYQRTDAVLPAPFVAYADFESILQPVGDGADVTQCLGVGVESSTTAFQEHVPCSLAFKIVSSIDPNFFSSTSHVYW